MLYNNKIKTILFTLAIGLLHTWGCKNKPDASESSVMSTPTYETKEFKEFYDKFSTDSLFQMEHTVFPLEGMKRPADSIDIADPDFRWTQDKWVLHRPYDDMNGTFSREFLDISGLVIEKISDASGKYTMERRFGKLSSGWHLIYYREMGMY